MNVLSLLDELRIIAQNGLEYADDPYDRERYERLLELVSIYYGEALDLPPGAVRDRLADEFGHITPKLGAGAAIFDNDGRVLLMRRADSGSWCLPAGYTDPNETPAETAIRETREETGLEIETVGLVDLYTREPSDVDPHGFVGVLYLGDVQGGTLELSHEGDALQYWHLSDVPTWHLDHHQLTRDAYDLWRDR